MNMIAPSQEPNIVTEHKDIKIALTPDYKFVTVGSELLNGGKYHSLKNIKKAINDRLSIVAKVQALQAAQTAVLPLRVLDVEGNECNITGFSRKNAWSAEILGLPEGSCCFYPVADWIPGMITEVNALEAKLQTLQDKLRAVMLRGYFHNQSADEDEEQFGNLLMEFEQKRKLAEAGLGAIVSDELMEDAA